MEGVRGLAEILQCSEFSEYQCVMEMIDNIDNETKILREGKNEGQGLWYHDELSSIFIEFS
jgi:hypothetical protein